MRLLPLEYAVRNLGRSRSRLVLSVGGSALVVLLALCAAGFVRGMVAGLAGSGSPSNIMVLGAGSEESIERSEVDAATASLLAASIDGLRTAGGVLFVSPEIHSQLRASTMGHAADDGPSILVRGVLPEALLVHGGVQIVEGRFPRAGANEVLVGDAVARAIGASDAALGLGSVLTLGEEPWTIVGRFASPRTVMSGEAWVPLEDLRVSTRRTTDSCVVIALADAEFDDVDFFCKTRLDLELVAVRETEYYAGLRRFFAPIRIVVITTAVLIGLGGVLGGLNTMYAAFAARVRELGMLQCLGYRRMAIALSLVQESTVAAAAGALVAAAIGSFVLDGTIIRFSTGTFGLRIDGPVMAIGLACGFLVGLVGAVPPALRALRLPIPEALKSI
ncbi:MAG: hypothetical protein KDA22_04000 [Phycisphaerales bacterium]|nr:hypothetical protein [Phycisphaerales bacterium]